MNNNKLLMAVAAVALSVGTGGALAQQEPQRGAPAERTAPKAPAAPKAGAGETHHNAASGGGAMQRGEAETDRRSAGDRKAVEERGDRAKSNREGQNREGQNREGQSGGRPETTGQAPQEHRDSEHRDSEHRDSEHRDSERRDNERRDGERSDSQRRNSERQGNEVNAPHPFQDRELGGRTEERSRDNERTTTGQGAAPTKGSNASLSVDITPEHRARMHDVFINERSAPRVDHVDFSLSAGTHVPRSLRIIPLPVSIVELQPTWRGYDYFMLGDQVVIVDPRTMEIVAVLDV